MRSSIAWVLLFAACYHDPGRTALPAPSNTVEVKPAHGPSYRDTIADPLGFLPLDSEIVLGLSGDQVRQSGLWKQLEPNLLAKIGPQLKTFMALCKLDPLESIHSLSVAVKNVGHDHPDGVLVVRGLDREALLACLSRTEGAERKVTIDDGVVSIEATASDPDNVVFRFVDRTTLVAVVGTTATKEVLQRVLRSGAPLRSSPVFNEMWTLLDTSGALWVLINGTGTIFDKAGALGLKPKAMFGSVSLAAGLSIDLRMRLGSVAEVTQIVTMAQSQLKSARALMERFDVTADNLDVVIALEMTDQQIQSLFGMFGMFGGASIFTPGPTPPTQPPPSP